MARAGNVKKIAQKLGNTEKHARKVEQIKGKNKYNKRMGRTDKIEPIPEPPVPKPKPTANIKRGAGRRTVEQRRVDKKDPQSPRGNKVHSDETQKQQPKENTKIPTSLDIDAAEKEAYRMKALLNAEPQDKVLKSIGATGKTLYGSFRTAMQDEGAWKKAGIGVVQSAGVSGAGHAGLAYLQGDDPWEAAKTGVVRGAIAGAGYQGMKAATYSKTGSVWGNMKNIGKTTKETYKVNTTKGFVETAQKGEISNSLKDVLMAKEHHQRNNAIFGLKGGV